MKKGFTLIELLVVIAIIGVLSSVVLASLNSARSKGNNVAVKSNLDTVRSQAQLFVDDHGGLYTGLCTDTTVVAALNAAKSAGSGVAPVCNVATNGGAWAAQVQYKNSTDGYACVDSIGISTTTVTALGTATACPSN